MKSGFLVLALGSVFLSDASALAQGRRGEDAGRYGWLSSLEAGKAQAKQSSKPLMVVIRCVP